MFYKIRRILHKLGFHFYSKKSSMMCGNVKEIDKMENWQKYSYRHCWICWKEKPHSRYFHNIGIKEKNAII